MFTCYRPLPCLDRSIALVTRELTEIRHMLVLFKRKIIAISYGIYVTAFVFYKLDSPIPSGHILWSVLYRKGQMVKPFATFCPQMR